MATVGVGIIVLNGEGKILVIKRKGGHAPYYSIPGGRLEDGETFKECAVREIKEETNIDISNPEVIAVTNNLQTYRNEGVHFISIVLLARRFSGTPEIMEPDKCGELLWVDLDNLPMPHFDASQKAVECYLGNYFYKEYSR